jgi:hypothetical protein
MSDFLFIGVITRDIVVGTLEQVVAPVMPRDLVTFTQ